MCSVLAHNGTLTCTTVQTISSECFPQMPQDNTVKLCVDSLTLRNQLLVHNSVNAEKMISILWVMFHTQRASFRLGNSRLFPLNPFGVPALISSNDLP